MKKMIDWLGYYHSYVDIFFLLKGRGLQVLHDNETIEKLKIEGVTHGAIKLFMSHFFEEEDNEDILYEVSIDVDHTRELTGRDEMKKWWKKKLDEDRFEEEYVSEIEEIIDIVEAARSDEEFINVQNKKRDWVLNRYDNRGSKVRFRKENSEDEGPFSLSDDEEDTKVLKQCQWPLYDPFTPFGSVQLELGKLFQNVGVLRKALVYYSCQTHTSWNYFHNEPNRFLVKYKFYSSGCHWKLSARYMSEYRCLQIRFLKDDHKYTPNMKIKRVHSAFLVVEYQEKLLKHPTWKLKFFIRDVEDTYGIIKGAPLHKLFWKAIKAYNEK
ncbi:hypothetical protein RDABS01_020474 [Bienertia sinuspersici]